MTLVWFDIPHTYTPSFSLSSPAGPGSEKDFFVILQIGTSSLC